jgi:hypothetical protein
MSTPRPYQRVNTATDYATVDMNGNPFPVFLRFDGSDDWLQTNTITPGTDKAQVFAGVRKLSDAAGAVVLETSINASDNAGALFLLAPGGTVATEKYVWRSRGTANGTATDSTTVAPVTNVLTGLGDISGDSAILRINGAQAAINTADQGTGNYLAYPLYIGRRAGTSLPFNGYLYSLVVRFGPNLDAATIANAENYVETKTFGKDMNYVFSDEVLTADNEQITTADGDPIYMEVNYQ